MNHAGKLAERTKPISSGTKLLTRELAQPGAYRSNVTKDHVEFDTKGGSVTAWCFIIQNVNPRPTRIIWSFETEFRL